MPSNGSEQTVFDQTVTVSDTSFDMTVITSGKNSYSNTNISPGWAWYLIVYIDGTLNNITGGSGAITDSVSLMGAGKSLAPGSHEVKVTWSGHSGMSYINAAMTIMVTKR